MFSIVSMQDVLVNLNNGSSLFKVFERTRTRKRSTSTMKAQHSETFPIQNIWILPSHILVLSGKSKQQLLAYDQYHKIGLSSSPSSDVPDLLSPLKEQKEDAGKVYDVFIDPEMNDRFVFILLKTGKLLVWKFMKPSYEWEYYKIFPLCKGPGCQLTSFAYNDSTIIWCEKRASLQCYVCVAEVNYSESEAGNDESDRKFSIRNTYCLLHNCLPMTIHPFKDSKFCLLPSSNRPPGLILFWSKEKNEITVHLWNDGLYKHFLEASSSDFQNIITSSISLWMENSAIDKKFITMTTHPTTKEIVVLQYDLQLHLVTCSQSGTINSKKLCILEINEDKETFSKHILQMYLWLRFLLVVTTDGEIIIFDSREGLYLWKSDTFKLNSPNIWIRQGLYPTVGVWNKSGIWHLRPKPIQDQVKDVNQELNDETLSEGKDLPIDSTDIDYVINVFGEQKKKRRRKIKQGVNRKTKMPIKYLLEVLDNWKLNNVSSEIALKLIMKLKESLKEEDSEFSLEYDEILFLVNHMHDPALLLILFTDKNFPVTIKSLLVEKLRSLLQQPLIENIDPEIVNVIKEYVNLQDQMKTCFEVKNESPLEKELAERDEVTGSELKYENLTEKDVKYILKYERSKFMQDILPFLLDDGDKPDVANEDLWRIVLKKESSLLHFICLVLWSDNPSLLYEFVSKGIEKLSDGLVGFYCANSFYSKVFEVIDLPEREPNMDAKTIEKVLIHCKLLHKRDVTNYDMTSQIYLDYDLIDQAVEILSLTEENSEMHLSILYRLFMYLLKNKKLTSYIESLLKHVPKVFQTVQLFTVLDQVVNENDSDNVFATTNQELSVGCLRSLFELVLEKENHE